MEKFIPYEKLSKKARREQDARRRGTWGGLNPVTRKPPNPKAYDRNRAKRRKYDDSDSSPCSFCIGIRTGRTRRTRAFRPGSGTSRCT